MRPAVVACLLLLADAAAVRAGDPFQTAPAPTADPFRAVPETIVAKPAPRLRPYRAPQAAVVAPPQAPAPSPAPPAPPAPPPLEAYEGVNGYWRVKAYMAGRTLTGEIECLYEGKWRKGPRFETTVDTAGNFNVLAKPNGWPLRQISGTLPQVNIHAINFDINLNCRDGGVTLQKTK